MTGSTKKKRIWLLPVCLVAVLAAAFFIYAMNYYHADETALSALRSDGTVLVSPTDYGWFFDGPSEENLLVFYPGAKVEETAYAPLLHRLASQGMDVCLLKMPFRFAFFAADKASGVLAAYDYENEFVGGHSLGGAMAAIYAAEHGDEIRGAVLLAAYPTKQMPDDLLLLSIYGSEDDVLNAGKLAEGRALAPDRYEECVIEGGNHAQFGDYGIQKGDGNASVSREYQQLMTADLILQNIDPQ